MVFGDLRFQSWPNCCSVYIPTEFLNKWDAWRASWFYIQTEKNHHLKLPVPGTPSCSAWESAPKMDEGWLSVLERIEVLVKAGLTTTLVLAHAVACSIAPLQHHARAMWEFSGPNNPMHMVRGSAPFPLPRRSRRWSEHALARRLMISSTSRWARRRSASLKGRGESTRGDASDHRPQLGTPNRESPIPRGKHD